MKSMHFKNTITDVGLKNVKEVTKLHSILNAKKPLIAKSTYNANLIFRLRNFISYMLWL